MMISYMRANECPNRTLCIYKIFVHMILNSKLKIINIRRDARVICRIAKVEYYYLTGEFLVMSNLSLKFKTEFGSAALHPAEMPQLNPINHYQVLLSPTTKHPRSHHCSVMNSTGYTTSTTLNPFPGLSGLQPSHEADISE
jgi:hypothetical protein